MYLFQIFCIFFRHFLGFLPILYVYSHILCITPLPATKYSAPPEILHLECPPIIPKKCPLEAENIFQGAETFIPVSRNTPSGSVSYHGPGRCRSLRLSKNSIALGWDSYKNYLQALHSFEFLCGKICPVHRLPAFFIADRDGYIHFRFIPHYH